MQTTAILVISGRFFCMKHLIAISIFLLCNVISKAQLPVNGQINDSSYVLSSVVIGKDTLPIVTLRTADITKRRKRKKYTKAEIYNARLRKYVIKVYPYAKLAGELFEAYESELDSLKTETEKKVFMKIAEEELRAEFEGELRKLTIMQGQILVKLVNRETSKTGYDIVKEMRGGFSAFFWQGIARLFGTDLKSTYDPLSEDAKIEQIIQEIERGEIYIVERKANTMAAQKQLYKERMNKKRRRKLSK